MRFEIFGRVRVVRDEGEIAAPSGRLQRTLLAALLSSQEHRVGGDRLTELLWPGDVAGQVVGRLHVLAHRLRAQVGPERLLADGSGYRLVVARDELDADLLEDAVRAVSEMQDTVQPELVARLRAALDGTHGTPYADISADGFDGERARLAELRLTGLTLMFQSDLDAGHDAVLIPALRDATARYPLSELLCAQLMVALHRAGRSAEALQAFAVTRRLLVDDLGAEPGERLQALHRFILQSDAPAPPPIPAELPPAPSALVGREKEQAELDDLMSHEATQPGIAVLSGQAGVGKSALALAWARRHRDSFPDGQLFVDLGGFGRAGALPSGDALARLLRSLGAGDSPLPASVPERSALYRSVVAQRRLLVVLDDAGSADQVRPLLAGSSSVVTVITSRLELTGLAGVSTTRITVPPLTADAADTLLRRSIRSATDDPSFSSALARLARLCAHLPLTLHIAGHRVREQSGDVPEAAAAVIAELVTELTDERTRLDALATPSDLAQDVRAVFSASYEALVPTEAELFRRLGLLTHPADLGTLTALWQRGEGATRRTLRSLTDLHLVENRAGGRVLPHDLLSAFAREMLERDESPESVENAARRLRSRWLHATMRAAAALEIGQPLSVEPPDPDIAELVPSFTGGDEAATWIGRDWPAIAAAAEARTPDAPAFRFTVMAKLALYLSMSGRADGAVRISEAVLRDQVVLGSLRGQASAETALGLLADSFGDIEIARAHHGRALALWREVGDPDREAAVRNNLGLNLGRSGRLNEAREMILSALALIPDRTANGIRLGNLASIEATLALPSAPGRAAEALDVARASGNERLRMAVLHTIASTAIAGHRLAEAAEAADGALEIAHRLGYRAMQGQATEVHAEIARERGLLEDALRLHDMALQTARTTRDTLSMIDALIGTGRTLHRSGDPESAAIHVREALAEASRHGLETKRTAALAALREIRETPERRAG